jgi:methylphosphotriester-DNA--protein-cysteine methyltransferase
MSKRSIRDTVLVGGTIAVIAVGVGGSAYVQRQRDTRIDAIMAGEIRANRETHIYHVPTCPQYNSINVNNLRTFSSVSEAEEANYRPSRNCLDAAATRNINETEINEGPDGIHDDPRY